MMKEWIFGRWRALLGVGLLASLAFLIFALVRGEDLGAPTGMLVGLRLVAAVTLVLSRRRCVSLRAWAIVEAEAPASGETRDLAGDDGITAIP